MKIAFIGGGVMAEAMIRGILDKDLVKAKDIIVSDISTERCSHLIKEYGVAIAPNNRAVVKGAAVIVLAVLPRSLYEIMDELKGYLKAQQLVLSIVARASLVTIRQGLSHGAVARVMPNMPVQVEEGMSVWTATGEVNKQQKEKVRSILGALGKELFVTDERYLEMATAVSGSGPAYIFLIIESFIDAAVHIGFPREVAEQLVLQTIFGTTKLAQLTQRHPAELRNLVTTPGGTTAEGLLVLERGGLRSLISQAVIAAYEKVKTMDRKG